LYTNQKKEQKMKDSETKTHKTETKLGPNDLIVEVIYKVFDRNGLILEQQGVASFPHVICPAYEDVASKRLEEYLQPNQRALVHRVQQVANERWEAAHPEKAKGKAASPFDRVSPEDFDLGQPKPAAEQQPVTPNPSVGTPAQPEVPPMQAVG
jgi:hypothetical protein